MPAETIVYYVGSDKALADALRGLLQIYDIEVQSYDDGSSFLAALETSDTGECCLLIELEQALEPLLETLSLKECNCPTIVLTEVAEQQDREKLIEAGATDLVDKPLVSAYIYTRLAEIVPGASRMPRTPASTMELADGTLVTFRMMRPDDSQLYQEFVTGLSDQSRYLRFFSGIKQLPSYMLEELTNPKFPISYALIATIPEDNGEREIGVARYAPTDDDRTAEFAVIVADEWQGHGIASQLMRAVITAAAIGGLERIEGIVLMENAAMLGLAESLGFSKASGSDAGPSIVRVVKDLKERKPEAP